MDQRKEDSGQEKIKKYWKNSKERRTYQTSNQQKNEFTSRRSRTKKAKPSQQEKALQTCSAEFYAKHYDDDEGEENTAKNEAVTCTESKEKRLITSSQFRSSRQAKSKMQLTVSNEGKQTAVGSEQNRSTIAAMKRKNGSDRSSTQYCSKRNARREHGV